LGGKRHLFRKSFEFAQESPTLAKRQKKQIKNIEKCSKILIIQGFSTFSGWHLFCQSVPKIKATFRGRFNFYPSRRRRLGM